MTYYTQTDVTAHTLSRAAAINTQFTAIETGFALLPAAAVIGEGRANYVSDTGSANAYLVTMTPTATAYTAGMEVVFIPDNANTGASTVNVDSLGVKSIKRRGGSDLVAGDLSSAAIAMMRYDGSEFQMQSIQTTSVAALPLAVVNGGTAATSAGGARSSLSAAALGANSDITSLTGLTTDLTVAQGGTGAGTFTDGGVLLGSGTGAITAMAVLADGEIIVGDGTTDPVAESGATARTSLGAAALGANSDITSLTGLTTDLTVAQGGTGAGTFTDGGVLLGSGTGAITAMAVLANGEMIVGDGTADPVAESGGTLRTSIGLGTVATLDTGSSDGNVPLVGTASASVTLAGAVELATNAEAVTGTDTARAVTPAGVVAKLAAPGAIGGTTAAAITGTTIDATGKVTAGAKLDLNGTELILDADADTSITADTDDTIDIRIAGADDFQFTPNTFTALSGSDIAIASGATITNSGTATGFGADAERAIAGVLQANANFVDQVIFGPAVDGVPWNGFWDKASVYSSLMLATIEDEGSNTEINIWDLTEQSAGVISTTPLATIDLASAATPTAIAAAMGYLIVSSEDGIAIIDPHSGAWAERTSGWPKSLTASTAPALTNADVISVCAGLSFAPILDPRTGGPLPTFGLSYGTGADGVAILHNDGNVYDRVLTAGAAGAKGCFITKGRIWWAEAQSGTNKFYGSNPIETITADDWTVFTYVRNDSTGYGFGAENAASAANEVFALASAEGLTTAILSREVMLMRCLLPPTEHTPPDI
jgi:hypothetical protein